MMLWYLWVATAWAGTVEFQIHGISRAQAVEIVVENGEEVIHSSCADQGVSPDEDVDGIWTCGPLDLQQDTTVATVIADSVTARHTTINVTQSTVYLHAEGRKLSQQEDEPGANPSASASGPGMLLLAQLHMGDEARVPVLVIRNTLGNSQLFCRDDGSGFDHKSNDANYMCSGWLPGPETETSFQSEAILRESMGIESSLGSVVHTGGKGIRYAQFDGTGEASPGLERFALQIRGGPAHQNVRPPAMVSPPDHVVVEHDPAPPVDSAVYAPTGESPASSLSAVLTVCALLFGGWVGWRVRSARRGEPPLPAELEVVVDPAIGAGPSTDGPPILVRTLHVDLAIRHLVKTSTHRRTVVVSSDDQRLPAGCYRLRTDDIHDLRQAVAQLAQQSGSPLVVLICGRNVLQDRASPSPDPLVDALALLKELAWVAVVVTPQDSNIPGVAQWTLDESGAWSNGA